MAANDVKSGGEDAEIAALRAQVSTMLRTESRLYTVQATLDRQLKLFERLHELGVQLVGCRQPVDIGRRVAKFATDYLRFDRAALLFRPAGSSFFEALGWAGFEDAPLARIRALRLDPDHPLIVRTNAGRHVSVTSSTTRSEPEIVALAASLGLSSFTAYALANASTRCWGVLVAGNLDPSVADPDEVSSRGLASLAAQSAAHLSAVVANNEVRSERALLEKRVLARTQELAAALEEVTRLARVDPLTGLLNRRAFMENAEQAIALARRYQRTCAVVAVDIDHFKSVNDTFGHQVGDAVLVSVAKALAGAVRETDSVGRYGGEEFAVVLAETAPLSVAEVCERLRQSLGAADLSALTGGARQITASFGVAVFPEHGERLDKLLGCADVALYVAKDAGRNAVIMYDRTHADRNRNGVSPE